LIAKMTIFNYPSNSKYYRKYGHGLKGLAKLLNLSIPAVSSMERRGELKLILELRGIKTKETPMDNL